MGNKPSTPESTSSIAPRKIRLFSLSSGNNRFTDLLEFEEVDYHQVFFDLVMSSLKAQQNKIKNSCLLQDAEESNLSRFEQKQYDELIRKTIFHKSLLKVNRYQPLNEMLVGLIDPLHLNMGSSVDQFLRAKNLDLSVESTQSSGEVNKSWEKCIQDGLNLDYSRLKTKEVIDLVAHYFRNHTMNFFETECGSRGVLNTTYHFAEQFTEGRFQKFSMKVPPRNSQGSCSCFCVQTAPEFEEIREQEYKKMIKRIEMPDVDEISQFIVCVVTGLRIQPKSSKSIVILALIYLEKAILKSQQLSSKSFKSDNGSLSFPECDQFGLTKQPQLQIYAQNWRPLIYTAILVATKYWEDKYFWNIDVVEKIKVFDLKQTNKFENLFVLLLDFEFKVDNEIFEEYFKWLVLYQHYIWSFEDKDKSY